MFDQFAPLPDPVAVGPSATQVTCAAALPHNSAKMIANFLI
jgi:hypothetical protein